LNEGVCCVETGAQKQDGRQAEIQDPRLSSLRLVRTRARLFTAVQDVPYLFPVAEPEGRNPRRPEVQLVELLAGRVC
jgi:hypothetical protein